MTYERTFTVGEQPRLEVDLPAGSVRVVEGDAGTIQVRIDQGDDDRLDVDQVGDTVVVRQRAQWGLRTRNVKLTANVPVGCDVDVHTASSDVSLRGRFGDVRARTASGAIEVEHADRADLHSASGNIRVETVLGELTAKTASGNITVTRADGHVDASLASGTLRCDDVQGSLAASTASGDVRVRRCCGDDVTIKTVSGDVSLGLPSGVRVEPDISTLSGKTVLPDRSASPTPADQPRRPVRVRLRTISGDIRIDRA